MAPETQYETRVRDTVAWLAMALRQARQVERSLQEATVLVVCTDGGGVWSEREGEVVRELNGATAYGSWVKASGNTERR